MALLCDYTELHYNKDMLMEGLNSNGSLILKDVILQRADSKNQNGRVYPVEILMRESAAYNNNFVKQRRALGELDHPESPVVNLKNVCCNVVKLWSDGDTVMGNIEILTTPTGNIVRELIRNNIKLGVSSRGMGSVKQIGESSVEVQSDYALICFDIVSNPSTMGAFITENTTIASPSVIQYDRIDKLIYDFLSEIK